MKKGNNLFVLLYRLDIVNGFFLVKFKYYFKKVLF